MSPRNKTAHLGLYDTLADWEVAMSVTVNDISAVVAVMDYARARSWYSCVLGREPDLEPIEGVAEWQLTNTAWL